MNLIIPILINHCAYEILNNWNTYKEALALFLLSDNWGIKRLLQGIKVNAHADAWAIS